MISVLSSSLAALNAEIVSAIPSSSEASVRIRCVKSSCT